MKKFIKKYKYCAIWSIGLVIMFIGASNSLTNLGMMMFGLGMCIALIGVAGQLLEGEPNAFK